MRVFDAADTAVDANTPTTHATGCRPAGIGSGDFTIGGAHGPRMWLAAWLVFGVFSWGSPGPRLSFGAAFSVT